MKSTRPSPVKSPAMMRFHQPLLFSSPRTFGLLGACRRPALWKMVIGIHSPTTTRSCLPIAVDVRQTASVTMPTCDRPGAAVSVTSVKWPRPSFLRSTLCGSMPYRPGTLRPPTNRSIAPSPSKSAAATRDPLVASGGHGANRFPEVALAVIQVKPVLERRSSPPSTHFPPVTT